ncbi:Pr6Pr family membrane protein [Pinirhizobacter sp.]|jgi:hypothetical protein|uniref:Pr6Pr family membrane protein n=1 Tax=Pinirhizobacter sp. TaxID=2950432 RepID=UPI002F3F2245
MNAADRIVGGLLALLAGFAVVLQLVLMLRNSEGGEAAIVLRFLSFFTILSNILVAGIGAAMAVARARPRWRGAAALYITVTGAIYSIVLAPLWSPTGAQKVADELLHHAVPVAYVLAWLVFSPHRRLAWGDGLRWLVFPAVYLVWTIARGALTGEYPYPFVDVGQLGVARVALNCMMTGGLFAVLGLVFVGIDRALPERDRP